MMKSLLRFGAAALLSSCVMHDASVRGPVSVGMSQAKARSAWGAPVKINRSNTSCCQIEQWLYREGYLYFENGKLTTWKYRE